MIALYLIEIAFFIINTVFALIQINMRKIDIAHGKEGGIDHFAWNSLYCGLAGVVWLIGFFVLGQNWWELIIAVLIIRIIYFNPLFNHLSHNPFFHLRKKGIDKIIQPIYKPFYVACIIGFIILQFFL